MRGKRIAVLEARLGRQLVELLESRGASVFHAPALAELPDLDPERIAALVRALQAAPPKVVIFQTGVGTKALFAATDETFKKIISSSIVVARGPKPTGALRALGVRIDRSAAEPFTTHEILHSISDINLANASVLVQRHGATNTELDRALEAAGASVIEIPTYRWSLPKDTAPLEHLVGRLERGEIDAAVFTNAEQARNLFLVSEKKSKTDVVKGALNRIVVASIGPVASGALRDAGVEVRVEAKPPKLGALLAALELAFTA
ncbi:MAG TPA: uroporphyrinogen-III synthase [Burkholderiales bacterium]|nr:uroporphyrinogen-III synthase [Burkholderiales bacterium]